MFLLRALWKPSNDNLPCLRDAVEIEFSSVYVAQDYSWDCGLAMIIMVMRWSGREKCMKLDKFYKREAPLWTIDIFDSLMESKVLRNCEFYTNSTDLSHHHLIEFYRPNILEDERRVTTLFQKSIDLHWDMHAVTHPLFARIVSSLIHRNHWTQLS